MEQRARPVVHSLIPAVSLLVQNDSATRLEEPLFAHGRTFLSEQLTHGRQLSYRLTSVDRNPWDWPKGPIRIPHHRNVASGMRGDYGVMPLSRFATGPLYPCS